MTSMCSRSSSMRQAHLARQLGDLVVLQQPQVLGDDALGRRALEAELAQLQREALLQVAGGDAGRVEALHQPQPLFDPVDVPGAHLGDFAHRGDQIAVVVEVADDRRADGAVVVVVGLERQLPLEVVGQRRAGRQRVLDRRQLLDLGRHPRAIAVVQVVVEEVLVVVVFPVVGLALGARCASCSSALSVAGWASAAWRSSDGISSSRGFSTTSWLSMSASSSVDIGSSLIACCNDGVRMSFCESFAWSF